MHSKILWKCLEGNSKYKFFKIYSSNVYMGNPIESTDNISEWISNFAKEFSGEMLIFKSQF